MKTISALLVLLLLLGVLISACLLPKAAPPVVSYFYGSPACISKGGSSNLSWGVTGADSVDIEPGVGTVPATGSHAVSPDSSTTYKLTAKSAAGSTMGDTSITVSAEAAAPAAPAPSPPVTVAPTPSATVPVINYFESSPNSIIPGGIATLVWSVTGASGVSIDNGVGTVPTQGRQGVLPLATTTYTLTATSQAGTVNASTTVDVTNIVPGQPPAVVISFTSSLEATLTQPFTISVEADPARAFQWQLDYFDPEYVSLVSSTFTGYNITSGATPGMQNFTFQALKVGDTRIKLSDVSVTDPLNSTSNYYDVHIIPYP